MNKNQIFVKGAKEHNLKNIDVIIPRDKFVVITGLSGSGKSSLAFDTIYAEGQRRYIETFSAYARSFLGNMERPDVDKITGTAVAQPEDRRTAQWSLVQLGVDASPFSAETAAASAELFAKSCHR